MKEAFQRLRLVDCAEVSSKITSCPLPVKLLRCVYTKKKQQQQQKKNIDFHIDFYGTVIYIVNCQVEVNTLFITKRSFIWCKIPNKYFFEVGKILVKSESKICNSSFAKEVRFSIKSAC